MQPLDMLTINEAPRNIEDLMETVQRAFNYFPMGIWNRINYVGNVNVKCQLKVKYRQGIHGAFVFSFLMRKIGEMRKLLSIKDLLLAVTPDPVIVTYHRFENSRFKRIVTLIHDYVSKDIGVISLFEMNEGAVTKIAAHGLGHNQGLAHHIEPIDLMYAGLLQGSSITIDGFCIKCQRTLKSRMKVEDEGPHSSRARH